MKNIFFVMLAVTISFVGCRQAHTAHSHTAGECTEAKCGSGHNHAHAEEEHDHAHAEEEHDHGHVEEEHGHDHSGAIAFSKEQAARIEFAVEEVRPHSFNQVLKTSGRILSSIGDESIVVANSNGVVAYASSALVEGSRVERNRNIFHIISRNVGEGDYFTQVRTAYENAKAGYDRASSLVEDQIISRQEFEKSRLEYERCRAAYEAVAASHTGRGVAVRAMMGGIVKELIVKEGEYVTVGQPLAVISQNERLTLRAEVSERHYADLRNVSTANFKTPYDDKVYALDELDGKLLSWGKTSGSNSFYVPVTFEFDNNGAIIPGSFVEIFLISKPMENVITVPVSALTNDMGNYYVYVQLHEEIYRKQEVVPGVDNGLEVQIVKGLKSGDRVVTKGVSSVKMASFSGAIPKGCNHAH